MIVYVVEVGVYAERFIWAVCSTLKKAKEAGEENHTTGPDDWRQTSDDEWDNGRDMGDLVTIYAFKLDP